MPGKILTTTEVGTSIIPILLRAKATGTNGGIAKMCTGRLAPGSALQPLSF